MTPLVIDASAFIEVSLRSSRGRRVAEVLTRGPWHVPVHFDAEVFGAFARLHRRGHIDAMQLNDLLGDLAVVAIQRHPIHEFLTDAAGRIDGLSAVDALYASLTAALDATLITCDQGLASRVPGAILIN